MHKPYACVNAYFIVVEQNCRVDLRGMLLCTCKGSPEDPGAPTERYLPNTIIPILNTETGKTLHLRTGVLWNLRALFSIERPFTSTLF